MTHVHVLLVNNEPHAVVSGTKDQAENALTNLRASHWQAWARRFGDGEQSRRVYSERHRVWVKTVPLVLMKPDAISVDFRREN